jgi:hypothetical protein
VLSFRWCEAAFQFYILYHLGGTSNRNGYQEFPWWGNVGPARLAANLNTICEATVQKMWEAEQLTTLWASLGCYSDSFTLVIILKYKQYGAGNKILAYR